MSFCESITLIFAQNLIIQYYEISEDLKKCGAKDIFDESKADFRKSVKTAKSTL